MEPDVRCIYRVYFRPEVMVLVGAKLLNRSLLMFREAPGRLARHAGNDGIVFCVPIKM